MESAALAVPLPDRDRSWWRAALVIGGATVLVLALLGGSVYAIGRARDDETAGAGAADGRDAVPSAATEARPSTTTAAPATTRATTGRAATGSTIVPPAQLTPIVPATTVPPTVTSTTTTAVPETTPAPVPETTAPPAPVAEPVTLPDGSPKPILAVFNGNQVTLEGTVPTEESRAYAEGLAAANAKGPATIDNRLTIDPSVPLTVPVRVIELQSVRFPSGSAEILPEHAAELDRVANIMQVLPHVTVLVVGHADQVGSEEINLVLSQDRAEAVVNYLISRGVSVDRLSSRGVGETDLLAEDLGGDALALNRRTEFVFTGILVPAVG